MSRPLDRNASLPELGEVDREGGEFWVENPFFIASSGNNLSAYERNRLFLNVDGMTFLDTSFASRADIDSDSRGVVAADFDRDGAPDLLVLSVGGGPLRLFRNRMAPASRVRLELVGTKSNRPGIGSRIEIEAGGQRLVRDMFAVNGGVAQAPAELIIGLGDAERIDALRVRWPTGKVSEYADLPVDRHITLTEDRPDPSIAPLLPEHEEPDAPSPPVDQTNPG